MMFLRHGMFARKSAVERHRKLVIGGILGLLLVVSVAIFAIVKAAGNSLNLGYTDGNNKGLTEGNITGTISTTSGASPATGLDRDGKAKLHLQFNFDDTVIAAATADANAIDDWTSNTWTYDLSSAVSNNAFIASFDDMTSQDIVNDGVVIAKYSVSGNKITITPERTADALNWWTNHTSNVRASLSLDFNIDKIGANAHSSDSFVLPGTTTPSNPSGNSTDSMYYDTPHVAIHGSVYDENSHEFKYGNNDKLISVEKDGNGDYIATYNTNFYMDVYAPDLKVAITLNGDQTPVYGYLKMKTCTTNNCIHDTNATTIDIPIDYVSVVDNRTVEFDMEGFLYDYCEVGGHDCTAAGIYGYTLNDPMSANNANHSDYYIEYKANLGSDNPAGNGKTYTAISTITGNNGAVTASDTVRYNIQIPGSKTGTCESGSTENNGVVTCNDDGNGNVYVNYTIKVGTPDTNLSSTTITDKITDNQVLASDITLTSPSGATITIAKPANQAAACANSDANDCVVWEAIDDSYSSNNQKLFSHAFSSGDTGEWTISYKTRIASDAVIGGNSVDNKIDLKFDQTTFYDVWTTSTHYEFARPMYVEKVEDYTRAADGLVHWTITVYGPTSGSLNNVNVTDQFWYDSNQYSTGSIINTIDSATKTVNDVTTNLNANTDYTTSTSNGNMVISIPTINAGEVYTFGIVSQADNDFKTAYAGASVALQNQACRSVQINNNTDTKCSTQVRTTILTPSADTATKTAQEDSGVFYWKQNYDEHNSNGHDYVYGIRRGYTWTVKINPNAGSVADTTRASDYEPWFSDVIPAGSYLTYRYDSNGKPEPECQGTCNPSTDIDQSKYSTVIDVKREIPSLAGQRDQHVSKVPVTVTNGVIDPINLAALFNDSGCTIPSNANPSLTCAGINGAIYTVTYATTLADDIYFDYANEHTFQNQAKLYEKVANTNVERANAVAQATYRNTSAIEKSDLTQTALDSTNKITYAITVNKAGYTYLNNGEPYAQDATRPMLTVTDVIPNDVNIMTSSFSATNLDYGVSANNVLTSTNSIVCTDVNDTIVNDCSFSYNSATRTLAAQIPDGYVRKIWYSVVVANPIPNKYSEYENTAHMVVGTVDFSSYEKRGHTVNGNAGHIIGNGNLKIKKVNANNLTEAVEGAEFKLVQVNYDNQGALGTETVVDLNPSDSDTTNGVSNASGEIQFSSLCGYSTSAPGSNASCPNGGQLYYWQEVSAPAPYLAAEGATKHYFVLYDEEVSASDTEANRAVAQAAANLIEENGSTSFLVEVLKSDYQWVVTNIKQEETSIAIEKKVKGNAADVGKEFTVTITATDLAGNPLNKTVNLYAYRLSNPSTITELSPITFSNGVASLQLEHSKGYVLGGVYVGGTYTITESNNTGYTVSYLCSNLELTSCSNTGTFVADAGAAADMNAGDDPTYAEIGQVVTLTNDNSSEITGITNKKPSAMIAIIFGSTVAALGLIVARRFRH